MYKDEERGQSSTAEKMYVVYLNEKGMNAHLNIKEDATAILLSDDEISNKIKPVAPTVVIPTTISGLREITDLPRPSHSMNTEINDWENHKIENTYALEAVAKRYTETKLTSVPCVLVHANGNHPGGCRVGRGQEESILQNSNLGFGMRNSFPQDDIWKGLGGIFAVLCRTHEGFPFWAIVNAAPNMNDYEIPFTVGDKKISTPSDANLFGRDPHRPDVISNPSIFMRHILGEALMQFYMVKSLGSNVFHSGLFGCAMFGGNPEYYSAAVRFVSQFPIFSNIKVAYAVGRNNMTISDRTINTVFSEPLDNMLKLAGEVFEKHFNKLCNGEPSVALQNISDAVQQYYCVELHRPLNSVAPQQNNAKSSFFSRAGLTRFFFGTSATTPSAAKDEKQLPTRGISNSSPR